MPQNIVKTSAGLYLLRRIRDEVHRYAISFHRKVRQKDMTKSIFEEIPGMGSKRIQLLWNKFESIKEIQDSKTEMIREKTGFPEKICKAIKNVSQGVNS